MKKINVDRYDELDKIFYDKACCLSEQSSGVSGRSAYFYSGSKITDRDPIYNCLHFSPIACDSEHFGLMPVFCLTSFLNGDSEMEYFFTAHQVGECPFGEEEDDD